MSQHDFQIDNQGMAAARTDLNNAIGALASNSSGSTAPASPTTHQFWLDTSSTPWLLKLYDGADWLTVLSFDATSNEVALTGGAGSASAPAISFSSDLDTGFYRTAANSMGLSLGGSNFATWSGTTLTLTSTDAGATVGPVLALERNSASPAASDIIGEVLWSGKDSGGAATSYAAIAAQLDDPTDTSEDARLQFYTMAAGTLAARVQIINGVIIGSPTGGDKGAGTLNAVAVYDDNTLLTCYAIEAAAKGAVDVAEWDRLSNKGEHAPARQFAARKEQDLDPERYAAFWKANGHLPAMPSRAEWEAKGPLSTGSIIQRLWETVEVQAAHIDALNARLKAVEARSLS